MRCLIHLIGRWVEHVAQIAAEMRHEQGRTAVHLLPKYWFGLIEISQHANVLCSLPGKQKHYWSLLMLNHMGEHTLVITCFQQAHRLLLVSADQHPPVSK